MLRIDRADAVHRMPDRDLQLLGERQQVSAPRRHSFTAWPTRMTGRSAVEQHVDGLLHAVGIGAAARRDVGAPFLRLRRFFGRGLQKHIERHVEHHRPGPACHHGLPGLPDRLRHLLAARRLDSTRLQMLRTVDGKSACALPVHLLERATVELRRVGTLPVTARKGIGIEIGRRERDRQVGRARARTT